MYMLYQQRQLVSTWKLNSVCNICSHLLKPRCEPDCLQTELDWKLLEAAGDKVYLYELPTVQTNTYLHIAYEEVVRSDRF